jgi:hypothetical protein
MRRCCVFAHFDPDGALDPYVLHYLSALKPFVQKLIFISTSKLGDEDIARVEQLGATVICRENIGYDFYSWKVGIGHLDLSEYDELLQANDSCYAPIFDFKSLFETMEKESCDFWGITKSRTYGTHLQSYFVCYRKSVIQSPVFKNFWENLRATNDKDTLVKRYEVGISRLLMDNGFTMVQYFTLSFFTWLKTFPRLLKLKFVDTPRNLNPYKYLRNLLLYTDPTFYYYQEMLKKEVPLIKVSLLKGVKRQMPATNLTRIQGIDLELVKLIRGHQIRTGSARNTNAWIPTPN